MDIVIERALAGLQSRHLNGFYSGNLEETRLQILSLIPKGAVVGAGDSATVRQIGILRILEDKGFKIRNPYKTEGTTIDPKHTHEHHKRITREATLTDVFIAGTNALTEDGILVNVDGVGNRVSGMVWGHPVSVILVGKNKIVKTLDEAFYRIRKIIAPSHVRIRAVELGGRRRETPCVETGECGDCRSPDRICNVFTMIEHKPFYTTVNVVIVNEDLGLGWDPSWPEERIRKIRENYKRFAWLPEMNYG
jgi:hypothetical protein